MPDKAAIAAPHEDETRHSLEAAEHSGHDPRSATTAPLAVRPEVSVAATAVTKPTIAAEAEVAAELDANHRGSVKPAVIK
jgi:hypothetical protein